MRALKPDDLERIAGQFRALGEPMRLKILQAVCKSPRMVGDIVTATGGMQANVSKHLALLASAGILARKKEGQRVFYGMKGQLAVKLCELVRTQIAE
ncbi:MAG TPA: metalloregulator ArsR/SmtB family transcription factor [Candidatus Sulfopaludibacter sp.]|nr:metalloregulator ArsR/SmtB family transcription factor [Candidatus Sulfopaludibacter sp.]